MGNVSELAGTRKAFTAELATGKSGEPRGRMKRWVCLAVATVVVCATSTSTAQTGQPTTSSSASSAQASAKKSESGSLKIHLRLEDETPFVGAVSVHVFPEQGYELLGTPVDAEGDAVYYAVPPGKYTVEVSAPGFLPVHLTTEIVGNDERTLFVAMKTGVAGVVKDEVILNATPAISAEQLEVEQQAAPETKNEAPMAAETAKAQELPKDRRVSPKPPEFEDADLPIDSRVGCPTQQVLLGAGQRMREFLSSMEKFTATETVEHYRVDKSGERKGPETRKFNYVVTVMRARNGAYGLDEFRDGSENREQFPGGIATLGLPAMALVFHPDYARDFTFKCEGLVHDGKHEYWQMRFAQREDRPVRIASYMVNGQGYPLYLKGKAWIDVGKSQIVQLESELAEPIPQIELWEQDQKISYRGVKFASIGGEIWLPAAAEVYVERHGKRYFRRHTFQDYRLFNVDTSQNVKAPKGSYTFTNLSDSDMTGELTVTPIEGVEGKPITLKFEVPAHRSVVKTVGLGKDVSLPPAEIGSAKFVYSGNAGSVKVDVDLLKETTLDVIPAGASEN